MLKKRDAKIPYRAVATDSGLTESEEIEFEILNKMYPSSPDGPAEKTEGEGHGPYKGYDTNLDLDEDGKEDSLSSPTPAPAPSLDSGAYDEQEHQALLKHYGKDIDKEKLAQDSQKLFEEIESQPEEDDFRMMALALQAMKKVGFFQPRADDKNQSDGGTYARSLLSGYTMDLSEPVVSGVKAPFLAAQKPKKGPEGQDIAKDFGEMLESATSLDELKQAFKEDVENRQKNIGKYPYEHLGGYTVGSLAPGSVGFRVARFFDNLFKVGKGGQGLTEFGKRMASDTSTAVTQGATMEGMNQLQKAAIGREELGKIPDAIQDSAVFGGGASFLTQAIPGIGKGIGFGFKKLLSTLGGVDDRVIDEYVKNLQRIEGAQSREDLEAEMTAIVKRVQQDYQDKKLNYDQAKETLSEAEKVARKDFADQTSYLRDDARTAKDDLDKSYNLEFDSRATQLDTEKGNLRVAQREAEDAYSQRAGMLKEAQDSTPYADKIWQDMDGLKEKIIRESQTAQQVLSRTHGGFPKYIPIAEIRKGIQKLKTGKTAVGQPRKDAIKKLEELIQDMNNISGNIQIPYSEYKKFRQSLDEIINWNKTQHGFDPILNGILKNVRRTTDQYVKNKVKPYAKQMEKFNKDVDLLDELDDLYPDLDRLSQGLKNINNVGHAEKKKLIEKLGRISGNDYHDAFFKAKGAAEELKIPKRDAVKGIPEYQAADQIKGKVAETQKGMTGEARRKYREGLPQNKIISEIEAKNKFRERQKDKLISGKTGTERAALREDQAAYKEAEAAWNDIKILAPDGAVRDKVKSVMRQTEPSEKSRKLFEKLAKLDDQELDSFIKQISDLGTKDKFEKDATRGSKNVNLYKALTLGLAGAGGAFGYDKAEGKGAFVLGGVGAGLGALVDRFGPRATRQILIKLSQAKNAPSRQTIMSWSQVPFQGRKLIVDAFEWAGSKAPTPYGWMGGKKTGERAGNVLFGPDDLTKREILRKELLQQGNIENIRDLEDQKIRRRALKRLKEK
jgi:hypothetical protein